MNNNITAQSVTYIVPVFYSCLWFVIFWIKQQEKKWKNFSLLINNHKFVIVTRNFYFFFADEFNQINIHQVHRIDEMVMEYQPSSPSPPPPQIKESWKWKKERERKKVAWFNHFEAHMCIRLKQWKLTGKINYKISIQTHTQTNTVCMKWLNGNDCHLMTMMTTKAKKKC